MASWSKTFGRAKKTERYQNRWDLWDFFYVGEPIPPSHSMGVFFGPKISSFWVIFVHFEHSQLDYSIFYIGPKMVLGIKDTLF